MAFHGLPLGLLVFAVVFLEMNIISKNSFIAACALCKSTVESATDSSQLSQGIAFGALFLLVPAVLIFSLIFLAVYKSDKELKD